MRIVVISRVFLIFFCIIGIVVWSLVVFFFFKIRNGSIIYYFGYLLWFGDINLIVCYFLFGLGSVEVVFEIFLIKCS